MVSPFDPRFFQEQRSRHAPHDQPSPAAEAAVRAARSAAQRRAAVGAQRRALTDDGAQGISATDARCCVFSKFTRSNRHVYAPEQRTRRFAYNCLIPFTFTTATCKRQHFHALWT